MNWWPKYASIDAGGWLLFDAQRTRLQRFMDSLGNDKVAVRSSGLNEDGAETSYAGVFESVLNVDAEGLPEALERVRASLSSQITNAYSGSQIEKGGILVQTMVAAEFAGVLFTEHPASTGCCLIELVTGTGEQLVSATVTPESYSFGRATGRLLGSSKPPIDLKPLIELGRRVEALFGRPQDIEWVFERGQFRLVQARNITKSCRDADGEVGVVERERHRLLELLARPDNDEASTLVQNELSELLPYPTPLSRSLMEKLWSAGGSTDIACQLLNIPYDVDDHSTPYVTTVFGALFVNRDEEKRRLGKGPGVAAAFRLARGAEGIEGEFRETFLPDFLRRMRVQSALDLSRLSVTELLDLVNSWVEEFVTKTLCSCRSHQRGNRILLEGRLPEADQE